MSRTRLDLEVNWMKKIVFKMQKTIFMLWKAILYMMLLFVFIGIYAIPNPQLLRLSRTTAVTLLIFVVVGLGMTAAYGKFDIGKRKSKPIIYSLGLATVITDVVTFIQLSVMNTNPQNNKTLQFENIGLLIPVIIIQVIIITAMTYGGNALYFRFNKPEISCIITSSQSSLNQIYNAVNRFKKQYHIKYIVDYKADNIYETIRKCHTVFLYDVPVEVRTSLVEYCYRHMRNVYFNPEIADIVEFNAQHVVVDDVSLLGATVKELSFEQRIIKRAMDLCISVLGLIISSPFWLICAVAIKLEDHGSIFFKQKRATKDGKVFEVYKFRTMKENVENYSSTEDDDRITKVGRVLRKCRLDELPQILNIIKGEMSLVGPRPEMLENVYSYTADLPEFEYRLRVKAGLTGYAQIAGKYNTSPRDKLILDLMYIEKYSIWKDIKLILQTLIVLFKTDSTEAFKEKHDVIFEKYDSPENGVRNDE